MGMKYLHSVIHKGSINKMVSGILDILIGYLDIHVTAGVGKNIQHVLRKWSLQEKYFKYQNFPTPLRSIGWGQ